MSVPHSVVHDKHENVFLTALAGRARELLVSGRCQKGQATFSSQGQNVAQTVLYPDYQSQHPKIPELRIERSS